MRLAWGQLTGDPACVHGPRLQNLRSAAPASRDMIMHAEKWYGVAWQWLSNSQAVMYGADQNGSVTTVLLTLSSQTTSGRIRCHADSKIAGAETSHGAAGQWLSNPQAVMYGVDQTGAVTTVLLTLSNPTVPQQPAGTVTNNNSEFCLPQCHLHALEPALFHVAEQSVPAC